MNARFLAYTKVIFLLNFSWPATRKKNITIRGSFDHSRLAMETNNAATVAFMGVLSPKWMATGRLRIS